MTDTEITHRERHTGHDGRLYELEPIKGRPGAFNVLYVSKCPECAVEFVSPTGGEGHADGCSRNPAPWTLSRSAAATVADAIAPSSVSETQMPDIQK